MALFLCLNQKKAPYLQRQNQRMCIIPYRAQVRCSIRNWAFFIPIDLIRKLSSDFKFIYEITAIFLEKLYALKGTYILWFWRTQREWIAVLYLLMPKPKYVWKH